MSLMQIRAFLQASDEIEFVRWLPEARKLA